MLEKDIEGYLVQEVTKLEGKCYKFVSPGNAGVPDRIVLLPGGLIGFVECKAPGKKPRKLQEHTINILRALGFVVDYVDSKDKVRNFLGKVMLQ